LRRRILIDQSQRVAIAGSDPREGGGELAARGFCVHRSCRRNTLPNYHRICVLPRPSRGQFRPEHVAHLGVNVIPPRRRVVPGDGRLLPPVATGGPGNCPRDSPPVGPVRRSARFALLRLAFCLPLSESWNSCTAGPMLITANSMASSRSVAAVKRPLSPSGGSMGQGLAVRCALPAGRIFSACRVAS